MPSQLFFVCRSTHTHTHSHAVRLQLHAVLNGSGSASVQYCLILLFFLSLYIFFPQFVKSRDLKTFLTNCPVNCAQCILAMISPWLLSSEKKRKPQTPAQEVLKRLLQRFFFKKCLSAGVAKLLISLVTFGLCVMLRESFTLWNQKLLFIPQYSPWAELPEWYFYKREGRKRVVWVWRKSEREREGMKEIRHGGKKDMEGDVKSVLFRSVKNFMKISWNKQSETLYLMSWTWPPLGLTYSLISRATHKTHTEDIFWKFDWRQTIKRISVSSPRETLTSHVQFGASL